MRGRKRAASARRNLFILALMILAFGAVSVGVHFIRLDAPWLSATPQATLETQRHSTENAFPFLKELSKEYLKERKKLLAKLHAGKRGRPVAEEEAEPPELERPSEPLFDILGFYEKAGVEDGFELRHWIASFAPLAEEACAVRDYSLFLSIPPLTRGFSTHSDLEWIAPFGRLMAGMALWAQRDRADEALSFRYLAAALHFCALVNAGYAEHLGYDVQEGVGASLHALITGSDDPAYLKRLLGFLEAIKLPSTDTTTLLESQFRILDNTTHGQIPEGLQGMRSGFHLRRYMAQLRGIARGLYPIREELRGALELPYVACRKRLRAMPAIEKTPRLFYEVDGVMHSNTRLINGFGGIRICCAVHCYFLEQGAWPNSLEELVPAYLEELPLDACDGAPLRYKRREAGGYLLYSVGSNGIDNGGNKRRDSILYTWPEPEEQRLN